MMKKISFVFTASFIVFLLLVSACSKKVDDTLVPDTNYVGLTEGFLTTKTKHNVGNLGDTAIIRVYGGGGQSGSYQIASTSLGGTLESQDHYWKIESAGSGGYVYVRSKKNGYYLGYRKEGASSGYHDWSINWATIDKDPTERNRLKIVKQENHFYIQPFDDNTLYLNTTLISQISYTGPQSPQELHFLENKQEFFFMKPF
jgi:hypothetical protein